MGERDRKRMRIGWMNHYHKIHVLWGVLTIVVITGLSCSRTEVKRPIKIGLCIWPGYAHAFVAQEKGFFKEHKVSVELLLKKDTVEVVESYRRGELDGLFGVFPDIIMLNEEVIPTQVLYVVDFPVTGDVIVGRPELRSLSDLKGKKVSFEGINSFSHIFVLGVLERVGLNEADVQFEIIPALEVLTALEEGKIDAGHTWEPIKSRALQKGYKILAKAGDAPGVIIDVLAFRAKVVRERPDDILRILRSILEAKGFTSSHRGEAMEIAARAMGTSAKELESGFSGIQFPDVRENLKVMTDAKGSMTLYRAGQMVIKFYEEHGQLSKRYNLHSIIEPCFLEQLAREEK